MDEDHDEPADIITIPTSGVTYDKIFPTKKYPVYTDIAVSFFGFYMDANISVQTSKKKELVKDREQTAFEGLFKLILMTESAFCPYIFE